MLQELISFTQSAEFKKDGSITIVAVRRTDAVGGLDDEKYDLELDLRVCLQNGEDIDFAKWVLLCTGVRKNRIVMDTASDFDVENNHPLLWPYTEDHFNLRIDGRTWDGAMAVGSMWQEHFFLADHWVPFQTYFNSENIAHALTYGDAKLASGPKTFLTTYKEVLEDYGLEGSLTLRSRRADNEEPDPLVVTMGESFVIATSFVALKGE